MKCSFFLVALSLLILPGCTATDILSRNLPAAAADSIHIYSRNEEPALNVIDEALANCPDETEKAETACVRDALSRSELGIGSLIALMPGCKPGSVCRYDHTTRRRLGLIPAYATIIEKNWRVTVDLRNGLAAAALPPITVTDRNVFVVTPPTAPVAGRANLAAKPPGTQESPAAP